MESARLPRFKRATEITPFQLTRRDREIIRTIQRHRFLRSSHIIALVGGSAQQVLRRLQLLFHHGYLDRPRAQIDYYREGGSRHLVYGLGRKGTSLLQREGRVAIADGSESNPAIGRLFLEHALLISDVMVALELACRAHGRVRLLTSSQLPLSNDTRRRQEPFHWSVKISGQHQCGIIPDRVFALEFDNHPAGRSYFFLEADRATMPVMRRGLAQSSFYRKLLSYEATWTQNIHRTRFGWPRFRVLTVTSSPERVQNLIEACTRLERGQGLFLFTDQDALVRHGDLLSLPWQSGRGGAVETLL